MVVLRKEEADGFKTPNHEVCGGLHSTLFGPFALTKPLDVVQQVSCAMNGLPYRERKRKIFNGLIL